MKALMFTARRHQSFGRHNSVDAKPVIGRRFAVAAALMAAAPLAVGSALAEPGKIGGFDIPTAPGPAKASSQAPNNQQLAQVVVSQSPGSKVTTITQAMGIVQPGGTILVRGGVYNENINVTKPVAIVGAIGDYGREPIIRASSNAPCVSIAPPSPVARVSIEKLIFEFDHSRSGAPCVNVAGGSVSVRDSAIIPVNADIPIRAAYGQLGRVRPDLNRHIARPPRDETIENAAARSLEEYISRHARPVGAENRGWDYLTGGTSIETYAHAKASVGGRRLTGPTAGVRVLAGDLTMDNNTIIGAQKAVEFVSHNRALVQGSLTNNVILGNGAGIAARGRVADLLLTRNTIKNNSGPGIEVDARDAYGEVKILANLIVGNDTGIFLSEKVRSAVVNSNFVAQNFGDAIRLSSGFFGAIAGNTLAANDGCSVDFFSAEQREINNAFIQVVAGRDFSPGVQYDSTNAALDNLGDRELTRRERRRLKKQKIDPDTMMPMCGAAR